MTPEQKAGMRLIGNKWIRCGLSTERANRVKAEEGVWLLAQQEAPLRNLRRAEWVESPLGLIKAKQREHWYPWSLIHSDLWNDVQKIIKQQSELHEVNQQLWARVRIRVWQRVLESVSREVEINALLAVWTRSREVAWISPYLSVADYYLQFCGVNEVERLTGLFLIAEHSHWFWGLSREVCFLCERPGQLFLDERGRLHCEDGPAVRYEDGFSVYVWHGTRVDRHIIEQPIDIQQINEETNAEVRRVMLERYGFDRFLVDGKMELEQRDDWGNEQLGDILK